MTDQLTPTAVNEWLDSHGMHESGRQPGVYAIELATPSDDAEQVTRQLHDAYDAPPEGLAERLAAAERFVYVGTHGESVYKRLCQHARSHQSSTIMAVWQPVDIVDVWPGEYPDAREYNRAVDLASVDTVAWMDGEWF